MSELIDLLLNNRPSPHVARQAERMVIEAMVMAMEGGGTDQNTVEREAANRVQRIREAYCPPALLGGGGDEVEGVGGRSNTISSPLSSSYFLTHAIVGPPKSSNALPSFSPVRTDRSPSNVNNKHLSSPTSGSTSAFGSPTFSSRSPGPLPPIAGRRAVGVPLASAFSSASFSAFEDKRVLSTEEEVSTPLSPQRGGVSSSCSHPCVSSSRHEKSPSLLSSLSSSLTMQSPMPMPLLLIDGLRFLNARHPITGATALHIACERGHFYGGGGGGQGEGSLIELLVRSGADTNLVDGSSMVSGGVGGGGGGYTALQKLLRDGRHSQLLVTAAAESIIRFGSVAIGTPPRRERKRRETSRLEKENAMPRQIIRGPVPMEETFEAKRQRAKDEEEARRKKSLLEAEAAEKAKRSAFYQAPFDPNVRATVGLRQTALHMACEMGHLDVVHMLLRCNDDGGSRKDNKAESAASPLEAAPQIDVNIQDAKGRTALSILLATHLPFPQIATAANAIISAQGFNPNVRDCYGRTALHFACIQKHFAVISLLMLAGADPNVIDRSPSSREEEEAYDDEDEEYDDNEDGSSSNEDTSNGQEDHTKHANDRDDARFSMLFSTEGGDEEAVALMQQLRKGRRRRRKGYGYTPVHWLLATPIIATEKMPYPKGLVRAAEAMLAGGGGGRGGSCCSSSGSGAARSASVDSTSQQQHPSPSKVNRIRFNADAQSSLGRTALHFACDYGHHDVAVLLLENGADASLTDHNGQTPLHVACPNTFAIIPNLLERGADVNALDAADRTPIDVLQERYYAINAMAAQGRPSGGSKGGGGAGVAGGRRGTTVSATSNASSPHNRGAPPPSSSSSTFLLSFIPPDFSNHAEMDKLFERFDKAFDALRAEGGTKSPTRSSPMKRSLRNRFS